MRNPFSQQRDTGGYPKTDAGSGSYNQYKYNLIPSNKRVVMQLAGSDPFQDEIDRVIGSSPLEAFVARRTVEEERTDAPVPVRFFVQQRMTGIVGYVPRGLEAVVLEALNRLDNAGRNTRIPAEIVKSRHGLRVNLLMGQTR